MKIETLDWLKNFKDTEFIKVITGVRRSGKSVILQQFQDFLLEQGVNEENILFYNFERLENAEFRTFDSLYSEVRKQTEGVKGVIYFIFDEIQEVDDWQRFVNGLRVSFDSDIYILLVQMLIYSQESWQHTLLEDTSNLKFSLFLSKNF
ncbi:MAG: AAA family ATPase [Micrococcaceae bacterium]